MGGWCKNALKLYGSTLVLHFLHPQVCEGPCDILSSEVVRVSTVQTSVKDRTCPPVHVWISTCSARVKHELKQKYYTPVMSAAEQMLLQRQQKISKLEQPGFCSVT